MGSFWIEGTIGAIKALVFVCDIITYPVYLILQRPWEKKTLSRRVKVSILSTMLFVYVAQGSDICVL
jgi:long-chain acyl-CoA synthetase